MALLKLHLNKLKNVILIKIHLFWLQNLIDKFQGKFIAGIRETTYSKFLRKQNGGGFNRLTSLQVIAFHWEK